MDISTAIPLIVIGIFIYIYREIFTILDSIKQDIADINDGFNRRIGVLTGR